MEAKGKVEKEGINPVRIEILNNDVQSVLQYETVQSETLITPVAGIGPEVHYVIGNTFVAQNESTTSGEEYAFSQDNREFQLIDLNEDNSEIEIVTVDGANILRDFQISSESFQIIDGNLNIQLPITSSSDGFPKPQQLVSIPGLSTSLSVSRSRNQKNAPALLRNSRRVEETMKLPSSAERSVSEVSASLKQTSSSLFLENKRGNCAKTPGFSRRLSKRLGSRSHQVANLGDLPTSFTHVGQLISPSQYVNVTAATNYEERFQLFQNGTEIYADNSVILQLDSEADSNFMLNDSNVEEIEVPKPVKKKIRKTEKEAKKKVVKECTPKNVRKGGGACELKCMEKGCTTIAHNLILLRKHLTEAHEMCFDTETKEFSSEQAFKEWRQQYERDRMVSFICRGGTKKVSNDLSVTYMICHRTGHYKPTLLDTSQRKRKLKPQGSCKIGGYCTAGIKLVKNRCSNSIKADICHTHYGHPLDSEAIPHLRVNPVLKKMIIKKFEEGMSFPDMLAYIHHNPDCLEGLRVVDRRAVRNIYDTWKKIPTDCNLRTTSCSVLNEVSEEASGTEEKYSSSTQENVAKFERDESGPYEDDLETDDDLPFLVSIDSVKSLRPVEATELNLEESAKSVKLFEHKLKEDVSTSLKTPDSDCKNLHGLTLDLENSATQSKHVIATPASSEKRRREKTVPKLKPIKISPELEAAIEKLHNHGEAGPSILLYKKIGEIQTKYTNGCSCRAFREDEFCLVIQTPVQRQIFQMFPKILNIDIIESPRTYESSLKLVYASVLDDYREAIPVAWMIVDSDITRYFNQFFKMLRHHCGELAVHFIIAPRNIEVLKVWTTHFSHKPKLLQNDLLVKRDLRVLLTRHFSNDPVRSTAWGIVENIVNEKFVDNLKAHKLSLEKIAMKRNANGHSYMRKMEKDWFTRISEWSFAYRVGVSPNTLFIMEDFFKLRKCVSFRGTRRLNQSIDNILKIGYDKCFLRTKRMFKGDQKMSKSLEKVNQFHKLAASNLKEVFVIPFASKDTWTIKSDQLEENFEVFYLQSCCECKIRCKNCNVCIHEYMCTCGDFRTQQTMCAHIHKVHCFRNNITLEEEEEKHHEKLPDPGTAIATPVTEVLIGVNSCQAEAAIVNDKDMEALNISEVLGLLGQQDGQEVPKILSITDVDTQKVIYDSSAYPFATFELDPD